MVGRKYLKLALSSVVGAIEGLLLARLIAQLFAARPDNAIYVMLYSLTAPLVWPWAWLDAWGGTPRFGARLELATLAAMLVVALIAGLWVWLRGRLSKGT